MLFYYKVHACLLLIRLLPSSANFTIFFLIHRLWLKSSFHPWLQRRGDQDPERREAGGISQFERLLITYRVGQRKGRLTSDPPNPCSDDFLLSGVPSYGQKSWSDDNTTKIYTR